MSLISRTKLYNSNVISSYLSFNVGPKLMGGWGEAPPQGTICRKCCFLAGFFWIWMSSFGGFWGKMMHKCMDLLALRNTFQQKLLNLRHIFYWYSLIVLTLSLDCKIWLNFSYRGPSSVIKCIDKTHVTTTVVVAVVFDSFFIRKF